MARPVLVLLAFFTVLCGIVYPASITLVSRVLFPDQAEGSLIEREGRVVGSALIGQGFSAPGYFWGRPSATSPDPYNAAASAASNLGPSNPALHDALARRVAAIQGSGPAPIDLVTTSASGLDPHISPASALYQVDRVALARGLPLAEVEKLVREHIEPRTFGVLGEARVNVLALNLALDQLTAPR